MTLIPVVNTFTKIPADLFSLLCKYETICAVTSVALVNETDVVEFLEEHGGKTLADKFKPEFLHHQ